MAATGRTPLQAWSPASQTRLLFSPHPPHLYALQRPRKIHFPVKISQVGNPRRLLSRLRLSACAPCLAPLTQTCACKLPVALEPEGMDKALNPRNV